MYLPNYSLRETWLNSCIKKPFCEDPLRSYMVTLLKPEQQFIYHIF